MIRGDGAIKRLHLQFSCLGMAQRFTNKCSYVNKPVFLMCAQGDNLFNLFGSRWGPLCTRDEAFQHKQHKHLAISGI